MALKDVARAAFQPARLPPGMEPGFYEHATYAPTLNTFPNGCHVCEVEIDPDTGEVALQSYLVVDDVGTVINPLTLAGQIHGGVAQGVGQILMEQVVYEPGSGQLLTASFMDYCMPRADDMCSMRIVSNPVPTEGNPLGAKGAGEAGCVGAHAGGDERDHACAGTARRARARHAGHQRSHLARDPRREGGVGAARTADRRRVPRGAARRAQGLGHRRRRGRGRHHASGHARHGGRICRLVRPALRSGVAGHRCSTTAKALPWGYVVPKSCRRSRRHGPVFLGDDLPQRRQHHAYAGLWASDRARRPGRGAGSAMHRPEQIDNAEAYRAAHRAHRALPDVLGGRRDHRLSHASRSRGARRAAHRARDRLPAWCCAARSACTPARPTPRTSISARFAASNTTSTARPSSCR